MASKKKEELLQPEVQTQAQPAAQSTYSAEGLNSRADVEKAMANVSYRPGQQVTDAADALKQWQQNRPADYQSSYQDKINSLLGQLLDRAGRVVVGLYACGNDAASVMRGTYPGPGTTLGPAFVFAWRAALFAARRAASARAHPIEEKP